MHEQLNWKWNLHDENTFTDLKTSINPEKHVEAWFWEPLLESMVYVYGMSISMECKNQKLN